MSQKKTVTIYDIARASKVSVATVSRVMNGTAAVKPETKAMVERVIREYNYHPNAMAQALSCKTSKSIAVIFPDISNPFYSSLFAETEKRASELEYIILYGNGFNDRSRESIFIDEFLERQVDGFIISGGGIHSVPDSSRSWEPFARIMSQVPLVTVNAQVPGLNYRAVNADEESGMRELASHLVSLGHRKFAFAGGGSGNVSSLEKFLYSRHALESSGIDPESVPFIPTGWLPSSGQAAFRTLAETAPSTTAVICVNDLCALGFMKAARDAGLSVPGDLSVTGFDDIPMAEFSNPGITTINQNYPELGRIAVDMISEGTDYSVQDAVRKVPVRMIVRGSTAAPGKGLSPRT